MTLKGVVLKGLRQHPHIRDRIDQLLSVIDDSAGDLKLADEAEERLIVEIKHLGQKAMQAWADGQVRRTEEDIRNGGHAYREGKKKLN